MLLREVPAHLLVKVVDIKVRQPKDTKKKLQDTGVIQAHRLEEQKAKTGQNAFRGVPHLPVDGVKPQGARPKRSSASGEQLWSVNFWFPQISEDFTDNSSSEQIN